jgi:hypothetical protein
MNSDPLIAHETQPTKTVAELVRSDERLKEEFARITLPLLILHGTEDRAAKPSGSQLFYDRAGSTDKTLKLYTASSGSAPSRQASSPRLPQMRWTPDEVRANQTGTEQVGSSFLAGVSTKVLAGDPSKSGFYTIILSVPANTTIPAHSHRDDRMATVVSGTWQFGYGDRFDENVLKRLPPGSVYSEPGDGNHFARTGAEESLMIDTAHSLRSAAHRCGLLTVL